jgi:hypothetical protein
MPPTIAIIGRRTLKRYDTLGCPSSSRRSRLRFSIAWRSFPDRRSTSNRSRRSRRSSLYFLLIGREADSDISIHSALSPVDKLTGKNTSAIRRKMIMIILKYLAKDRKIFFKLIICLYFIHIASHNGFFLHSMSRDRLHQRPFRHLQLCWRQMHRAN